MQIVPSYRMSFDRRKSMSNMPLIIINFEGVIGEILSLPVFDPYAQHGLYLK